MSEVWHKVHEKELSKYLLLLVTTFCCYVAQSSLKELRKCRQNVGKRTVEKENERSPTLVGEGEGVRGVSQGEPLMQKERENERKAGT